MSWSSYRSRGSGSRSSESRYGGFAPYVPVAQRRAQAEKTAAKATKDGAGWSPVAIKGRKIATTFWGAAWCEHLESYSDYANRLPRGRTYARNGSVVDLQISAGLIAARVQGSSLYQEAIRIQPLAPAKWAAIKAACAGKVTSLVGLLQGTLPDAVLRVITERATGLFPAPSEIKLSCSCPDSAGLCKHLAAVLYGVGARLDTRPELLFLLRGVDHEELVTEAIDAVTRGTGGGQGTSGGSGLDDAELANVFGIDLGGEGESAPAIARGPVATKASESVPGVVSVVPAVKTSRAPKKVPLKTKVTKGALAKARPAAADAEVRPDRATPRTLDEILASLAEIGRASGADHPKL